MSSRLGIALQAVAVAALATVVYLAFLKPSDPGSLSSIDVADGTQIEVTQIPGKRSRSAEPARPNAAKRGAAAGEDVTVVTEVPSTPGVDVESPVGSQYAGSVARILGRVH